MEGVRLIEVDYGGRAYIFASTLSNGELIKFFFGMTENTFYNQLKSSEVVSSVLFQEHVL